VPLAARYDVHERVTGPALPHLFQRRIGNHWRVLGYDTVQRLLNETVARTGLRDIAGQPLRFTAHDFRRIFATDAVTGELPVHIAARLLGHSSVTTTKSYLAVFQDDLVRAYRSFLDTRRAVLADRISEAKQNGWLGEVCGLQPASRPPKPNSSASTEPPEHLLEHSPTSASHSFHLAPTTELEETLRTLADRTFL
jgi:hypothetical protein